MGLMTDKPSNDDIIDERIRALAAGQFNAPGVEPPRDAMWEAIASARRASRATAAAPGTDRAFTPLIPRRITQRTAWRWSAALAAGLILGVAVDRTLVKRSVPHSTPPIAKVSPTDTARARNGAGRESSAMAIAPSHVERSARGTSSSVNKVDVPTLDPSQLAQSESRSTIPADSLQLSFYRSAATQTLVQAEALLTSYRSSENKPRDPQAMQQAARWARDVLSSTRLLIDSPAGRDPHMRALFSDLELILAQLVQLSGAPLRADERELIERSIREHNLLPRLRSAVPSGLAAS
jgi:hypothetical protein